MNKGRLLWRLFLTYMVIALGAVIFIFWYGSRSFKKFYIHETARDLEARGQLLEQQIIGYLSDRDIAAVDSICKEKGGQISTRVTVIMADGKVIGDTESDPSTMDNHADRPEVMVALSGGMGENIRYSHTLRTEMLYVALPIYRGDDIIAVVRTSLPLTSLEATVWDNRKKIGLVTIILVVLIAGISLVISRRISKPLEDLKAGAERFASGDLEHRLRIRSSSEFEALSGSMNRMAALLDERIRAVIEQKNELDAILASMVESVIAIDSNERIMSINDAAAGLFGIGRSESVGKTLQESIRNVRLQEFVADALEAGEMIQKDIDNFDGHDTSLQIRATPLVGSEREKIGILIVVEDVTRLRKLEKIRKDFVANVSHELKTPITSIKGYLETIAGGQDFSTDTRKFLQTIIKQTDRLNAIIDDLLSLARIEKDSEEGEIVRERASVAGLLESAVDSCRSKAEDRDISLKVDCPAEIEGFINPALMEQAVANLIDNAVNYSNTGSEVRIEGKMVKDEIRISVIDKGTGIERKHLDRLFERFYRVDKARSRKNGGTGLGLAIVKHITQAHGGRVEVESEPGQGSSFSIIIPVSPKKS
jgi:two-component system phosphate regulon sensor histidine kinase PhoR